MLLKIIFDKAVFVKFKISNNFKQNIVEKHSQTTKNPQKNPYQPMDFETKNQKSQDLYLMFVISKTNTIP